MMIFSNRMNRFKRLFFILILFFCITNLLLAQKNISLQGTWMRTDTVNNEFVYSKAEFIKIKPNQKLKQKTFTQFYTFNTGGDLTIEQLILEDSRLARKGIKVLKTIDTGKWLTKHLGEDDFIELLITRSNDKEFAEIKNGIIAKNSW